MKALLQLLLVRLISINVIVVITAAVFLANNRLKSIRIKVPYRHLFIITGGG